MYKNLANNKSAKKLMYAICVIALMTWIHHIYGGLLYDTAYRIIAPTISIHLLLFATFYFQNRLLIKATKPIKYVYVLIVSLFWIVSIGLIEGFYNHILKNLLFFTSISEDKLSQMFPPEFGDLALFELPNDIFFEITGSVQFFIGIVLFFYLRKFINNLKMV